VQYYWFLSEATKKIYYRRFLFISITLLMIIITNNPGQIKADLLS